MLGVGGTIVAFGSENPKSDRLPVIRSTVAIIHQRSALAGTTAPLNVIYKRGAGFVTFRKNLPGSSLLGQ